MMSLKIGRYYKRRDGEKVGPLLDNEDKKFPFKYDSGNGYYKSVDQHGRYYGDERESCYDIIDDWVDEMKASKPFDEWRFPDWQRAYANFDKANRRGG